jgi:hypothetical protein
VVGSASPAPASLGGVPPSASLDASFVATSFAASFVAASFVVASLELPSPPESGVVSSLVLEPHATSHAAVRKSSRFMKATLRRQGARARKFPVN